MLSVFYVIVRKNGESSLLFYSTGAYSGARISNSKAPSVPFTLNLEMPSVLWRTAVCPNRSILIRKYKHKWGGRGGWGRGGANCITSAL
jgi:hypothetical protein